MDKLIFPLLKILGVEDPEISEVLSSLIFTSAVIFTGMVYFNLNKGLKSFMQTTDKTLKIQDKRIDNIESNILDDNNRVNSMFSIFSTKFEKGMDKLEKAMDHMKELTIYNKNIKDVQTYETRVKIRMAGVTSWNSCKRRLKEWSRNSMSEELIKSMSGIELHSHFIKKALTIYADDDRKTRSNTINPVENELLNVIDFKVLPTLQTEMLPLIQDIKYNGSYTSEHEDEMTEIIEKNQNLWLSLFDNEYFNQ
jgi:hypothetical protein